MDQIQTLNIPYSEIGYGFLLGLSMGYAIKKSFRGLLLLIGFGFVFMILLESQGTISIDQAPLREVIDLGIEKLQHIWELLQKKFIIEHKIAGISLLTGFAAGSTIK